MKTIDTHHIGGFIMNTIKPLIEELDQLLGKCQYLKLDNEDISFLILHTVDFELKKVVLQLITWIILGVCGCLTTYFILH